MTTYAEKLRHPKWQRKRLEVLEAAGFECQYCGDKDSTLHVHHGYYAKGREPWEYESDSLHVLCEKCHEESEWWRAKVYALIGRLWAGDVRTLHGYLQAAVCSQNSSDLPIPEDVQETYGIAAWAGADQRLVEFVLLRLKRSQVAAEQFLPGYPGSIVDDVLAQTTAMKILCGLGAGRKA